ncbi:MAG: hypothetical protein AABZ32_09205, partial [Bacteroidota bacterium]
MKLTKIDTPFIFVIFGASGDLARIKLFPAIYELMHQRRFAKPFLIYGFARTTRSVQEFRSEFISSVRKKFGKETNEKVLEELVSHVNYFSGNYDNPSDYEKFFAQLATHQPDLGQTTPITLIAYYSVPPTSFNDITKNLAPFKEKYAMHLVIEKPFGENEKSARDMLAIIEENFEEEDVYLLDHYLGKESVQSILSMRYTNSIINHLLKGELIKYIQINAFEPYGVKERGRYFDQVGIIKDMIQSHLLQLLALVT